MGAAVAEIVFTFVLCFVVLSVATTKDASKDMFGLAIASCVTVGGNAIGSISGGSRNCLLYSAHEFIGAALAAGVFYATRPGEFAKGSETLLNKETYGATA